MASKKKATTKKAKTAAPAKSKPKTTNKRKKKAEPAEMEAAPAEDSDM